MSKLAKATQVIDNPRAKATRFEFEPGADTGWHTHEMDYVIVALTDCTIRAENPDGSIVESSVAAGDAYYRDKGIRHNVFNGGSEAMAFIEIELV